MPPAIGNIQELRGLKLNDNRLTSVPGAIVRPVGLRMLELQHNELTSLPDSFALHKSYFIFYVHGNKLTRLPDFNHNSFNYFTAYDNELTSLPDSLSTCDIGNLWLQNNKIDSLPVTFGNIANLNLLYLDNNQLTSLPESFCNLKTMGYCYLSGNRLKALPDNFGNLTKLRWFRVEHNELSTLPASFVGAPLYSATTSFAYNKLCGSPQAVSTWLNSVDEDWTKTQNCGGITGSMNNGGAGPAKLFSILAATSANLTSAIQFTVPVAAHVKLDVYSVNGTLVETLVDAYKAPGTHSTVWNRNRLSSRTYYCRLTANGKTITKKILLVK